MTSFSMDARCLLTSWFMHGPKSVLSVGGATAKSRLTGRARSALDELLAAGYIEARPITKDGRMEFRGTDKRDQRLSLAEMEVHGAWSPTEPNPHASEAAKALPTATINLGGMR